MPKITISEEDLTISNVVDATENIAYIPGMLFADVDEKPRLFRSASSFTEAYGKEPYKFVSDQKVDDITVVGANNYEKSYIYALELLNAGLPVYFQNIVDIRDLILYSTQDITVPYTDCILLAPATVTEDSFEAYKYVEEEIGGFKYATEFKDNVTYYELKAPKDEYSSEDIYVLPHDDGLLKTFYDELKGKENKNNSKLNEILDRWTYNIKFITTGGYPTSINTKSDYGLLKTMATAAAVRADTIALIDTPYDENILDSYTNINDNIKVKDNENDFKIKGNHNNLNYILPEERKDEPTLKYASIIGPGAIYELYNTNLLSIEEIERTDNIPNVRLTGSFGYLLSLVNSTEDLKNPDYLAVAGISRGAVPHILSLTSETTGAQQDAVQVKDLDKISLNPIIKVQNYGYCIWGNRTMFPNIQTRKHPNGDLAASSFLNIRVMAADVKKVIYAACQKLTFETNNLELWLKFKSEVEPTLEQMVANGALKTPNPYELTRLVSTEKATLSVYVKLNTEYAVEDFNVTVGLTDSTVEEAE